MRGREGGRGDIAWHKRRKRRKTGRKGGMKEEFWTKGGIHWVGGTQNGGRDSGVSCLQLLLLLNITFTLQRHKMCSECSSDQKNKGTVCLKVSWKSQSHTNTWFGSIKETRRVYKKKQNKNVIGWYHIPVDSECVPDDIGDVRRWWVQYTGRVTSSRQKNRKKHRGTYCLLCVSCWRHSSQSSSAPSWRGKAQGHSTRTDRQCIRAAMHYFHWPLICWLFFLDSLISCLVYKSQKNGKSCCSVFP